MILDIDRVFSADELAVLNAGDPVKLAVEAA
jgi:hypothetical protein